MNQHIRTTHTGSLPRPDDLTDMLARRDKGAVVDGLDTRVADAVAEVVRRQVDAGLRIVNDGEAGKISYATYVAQRLDGFGGVDHSALPLPSESVDFPEFYARTWTAELSRPACVGPLRHRDLAPVEADVANLSAALERSGAPVDAFLTAASPGIIGLYLPNRHYPTHEEYLWALADVMKVEYDAIHAAGFILQLDCPDLPKCDADGLRRHIDVLNHATRDIPADRMRMHLCWGNYEGPHHHDVPLADIIEPVLAARPAGLSLEAANPRHAHEWRVFEEVALPEGKTLIPGVIDSTTNYVEHPQLVADRILQFARVVGPDRVIAGTDCGFATTATHILVDPAITWAKLRALSDGAAIATRSIARPPAR